MGEVSDAVHTIGEVAQASGPSTHHPYEGIGELAAALDEFDVSPRIATEFGYNAHMHCWCLALERVEFASILKQFLIVPILCGVRVTNK